MLPVKRVKVGTSWFRITQRADDTPDGTDAELDDYAGMTYHAHHVIYIRPNMHEDNEKVTMLHELLHVSCNQGGSQHHLRELSKESGSDPEELFVSAMSGNLWDLLRDNKKLTEWLLS